MSATQIVEGVELPAVGTWTIDPDHAEVAFVGRHLGLTRTRGRFSGIDGAAHIAADPANSAIEVTIDVGTLDSGSAARDESLRSAHYFDVEHHPTARFRSTAIVLDGTRGAVTGDLTVRGVTHPVTLDVEYLGHVSDPWQNERAAFSASATLNREDWGMTTNFLLDGGRLAVSKHIRLEIDLELVQQ